MKKLFTLLLLSSLYFSQLYAQPCGSTANVQTFGSNFKLLIQFANETESDQIADKDGTGCSSTANCYGISTLDINGTVLLDAGGTASISTSNLNQLKDHGTIDGGLRLDGNNVSGVGVFSGSVTFDGVTCVYVDGNLINVLPISLVNFTAKNNREAIILEWQTASEIDNDYIAVERSIDGVNFTEIGRVQGAGFSTSLINYSLEDKNPVKGVNYYRLRQVDFNDATEYSYVVQSTFKAQIGELSVFPTMVHGAKNLTVDLSNYNSKEGIMLELVSLDGKILETFVREGGDKITISISDLTSGMYFVRANNLQTISTGKFFITR